MSSVRTRFPLLHALVRSLCAAALVATLTACATLRTSPDPNIANSTVAEGQTVVTFAEQTFVAALRTSAADATDTGKARELFRAGQALLDLRCERYLDAVGLANQAASNERRQTSLIGGFVTGIMGLTGSPAKEISGVATAFSFAGASMDTYTAAYLFSDAAKSVGKIVRESQAEYLNSIQAELAQLDYPAAIQYLIGYEAVCRPPQIRALIDDAVARGKVVAEVKRTQPSDGEVAAVINALRATLGIPINEAQAINLYAWYNYPDQRTAGAKTANNAPLSTLLKSEANPSGRETVESLSAKLSQALLPTMLPGSQIPGRWAEAVGKILNQPTQRTSPQAGGGTPAATTPLRRMPILSIR